VANLAPSLRTSLCSEDWYQGLSDQDRTIVDEGVRVADAAVKAWAIEADKAAIAGLKEAGMDVYHNTAEEKAEFADLIRPQYSEILGSEELADFFVQAAGASR
jgi:TRAP-type C4-dicarboxylate transport system substrate-binding protein